jgi:hypothetical protein
MLFSFVLNILVAHTAYEPIGCDYTLATNSNSPIREIKSWVAIVGATPRSKLRTNHRSGAGPLGDADANQAIVS